MVWLDLTALTYLLYPSLLKGTAAKLKFPNQLLFMIKQFNFHEPVLGCNRLWQLWHCATCFGSWRLVLDLGYVILCNFFILGKKWGFVCTSFWYQYFWYYDTTDLSH